MRGVRDRRAALGADAAGVAGKVVRAVAAPAGELCMTTPRIPQNRNRYETHADRAQPHREFQRYGRSFAYEQGQRPGRDE